MTIQTFDPARAARALADEQLEAAFRHFAAEPELFTAVGLASTSNGAGTKGLDLTGTGPLRELVDTIDSLHISIPKGLWGDFVRGNPHHKPEVAVYCNRVRPLLGPAARAANALLATVPLPVAPPRGADLEAAKEASAILQGCPGVNAVTLVGPAARGQEGAGRIDLYIQTPKLRRALEDRSMEALSRTLQEAGSTESDRAFEGHTVLWRGYRLNLPPGSQLEPPQPAYGPVTVPLWRPQDTAAIREARLASPHTTQHPFPGGVIVRVAVGMPAFGEVFLDTGEVCYFGVATKGTLPDLRMDLRFSDEAILPAAIRKTVEEIEHEAWFKRWADALNRAWDESPYKAAFDEVHEHLLQREQNAKKPS